MFFLLHNLLLACLFIFGKKCEKSAKYWRPASVIIVVYTLVEGLRWGRGVDYNLYFFRYEDISHGYQTLDEPLYYYFCRLLSIIGLPYQGYILLTSGLLIFSVIFFMKDHRKVIKYALPIFFIVTETYTENLVRWYLGFSFVLIGMRYLQINEFKKSIFFAIVGISFHYGLFIVVLIFWILKNKEKILLKPVLSIILYLIILLMWDNSYMLILTKIVSNLGIERFQYYSNDADIWLTGSNRDEKVWSLVFILRQSAMCFFFLYYGYEIVKKNKDLTFLYNIMTIGCILFPAASRIELWSRINGLFYNFIFVIGGYIFYYTLDKKQLNNRYSVTITKLIIGVLLFISIRWSLTSDFRYSSFIWDANGRKVIPMENFMDKK